MKFPKPFFRKSKQAWYVQLGKKQHSLGKDREEAFRRYKDIILHEQARRPFPEPRPGSMVLPRSTPRWAGWANAQFLRI